MPYFLLVSRWRIWCFLRRILQMKPLSLKLIYILDIDLYPWYIYVAERKGYPCKRILRVAKPRIFDDKLVSWLPKRYVRFFYFPLLNDFNN
jgi:hypothetical protein